MREPSIIYTPIRFRRQKFNECSANSRACNVEKQFQIFKGLDLDIDAELLDNEVRAAFKKPEGIGISRNNIVSYMKKSGVLDKKTGKRFFIKNCYRVTFDGIQKALFEKGVMDLTIQAASLRIDAKTKIAKVISINKEATHAVALFALDTSKGYGIVDSNKSFMYYLPEEDFKKIFLNAAYFII